MWCDCQDFIQDGKLEKKFRCPKCGRRLFLREVFCGGWNELVGYKIPPHKVKGYKIKKKVPKRQEK